MGDLDAIVSVSLESLWSMIEDLTGSLPADSACCALTVRRDQQALEARFLTYTDHVDGRVRWKLVEGFCRVPAVQLSATEVMKSADNITATWGILAGTLIFS